MAYVAVNELEHFHFHDAEIKKLEFIDNQMIWKASAVNAERTNTQNDLGIAMCINDAEMIFEGVIIDSLVIGAHMTYDHNKNLIETKEAKTVKPSEYITLLQETVNDYCWINGMGNVVILEDGRYKAGFDIVGHEDVFFLTIIFTKSTVKWENYSGKAYYEHKKWNKPQS